MCRLACSSATRAFKNTCRVPKASQPWILGLRTFASSTAPRQTSPGVATSNNSEPTALKFQPFRAHSGPFPRRTHHCGSLSVQDAGSNVTLTGWLLPGRKVGKTLYFYPLKDSRGTIQLVVSSDVDAEVFERMRSIPVESTVLIQGTVSERPAKQKRPQPGGDIEVAVTACTLLNPAEEPLPFVPSDIANLPSEEFRLRYRYLDLRRSFLSGNLQKRSKVAHIIRTILHDQDFVEVETPILLKSTPEGAREFLVPTRLSASPPPITSSVSATPGSATTHPLFYALPQSPQQPKQLLIASGAVDRYYQIARCFRDEDGRKDRQPEFTQVDLEMAWVSWGDQLSARPDNDGWRIGGREVREIIECLIRKIWFNVEGIELPRAFKVMTYREAMSRFGSDKPDIRFDLELADVTARLPEPARDTLSKSDEIVEAIVVRGVDKHFQGALSKPEISQAAAKDGVCIVRALSDGIAVSASQDDLKAFLSSPNSVSNALELRPGDTAFLSRRPRIAEGGSTTLGRFRLLLSSHAQAAGELVLPPDPHFLWVTEFPLFTRADPDKEFLAQGRWSSSHHPFTAPMWEDIDKMYDGRVSEVRGQHYDLVLNGMEIGGGSVRVHDADMQEYIFAKILQLDERETSSFDHLLHALRCGAPPHGGIALGFDRLMSILCKTESIRDVIAFPKTGAGTDLLFKSPAAASIDVLHQYGIEPKTKS